MPPGPATLCDHDLLAFTRHALQALIRHADGAGVQLAGRLGRHGGRTAWQHGGWGVGSGGAGLVAAAWALVAVSAPCESFDARDLPASRAAGALGATGALRPAPCKLRWCRGMAQPISIELLSADRRPRPRFPPAPVTSRDRRKCTAWRQACCSLPGSWS